MIKEFDRQDTERRCDFFRLPASIGVTSPVTSFDTILGAMRTDRAEYRAREVREAAGAAPLPNGPITRVGSWQAAGTGYVTAAEETWAEAIRAQRRHTPIRRPEDRTDPGRLV